VGAKIHFFFIKTSKYLQKVSVPYFFSIFASRNFGKKNCLLILVLYETDRQLFIRQWRTLQPAFTTLLGGVVCFYRVGIVFVVLFVDARFCQVVHP
jgi:hypothetical protein